MSLLSTPAKIHQSFGLKVKELVKPEKLAWVATKLPKTLNCLATQQIINTAFSEQIADGDFEFLQERTLQIEILDAKLYLVLSYNQNKIICSHFSDNQIDSDATLSIDTANAIKLIQQEVDPDTLFFQRKLKINGDTELAHHVKNTIDTLDPEVIPSFVMKLITEYKQKVLTD